MFKALDHMVSTKETVNLIYTSSLLLSQCSTLSSYELLFSSRISLFLVGYYQGLLDTVSITRTIWFVNQNKPMLRPFLRFFYKQHWCLYGTILETFSHVFISELP